MVRDMVLKGEKDRIGMMHMENYLGYISVLKVESQNVFYTYFMMFSGGVMYYLF